MLLINKLLHNGIAQCCTDPLFESQFALGLFKYGQLSFVLSPSSSSFQYTRVMRHVAFMATTRYQHPEWRRSQCSMGQQTSSMSALSNRTRITLPDTGTQWTSSVTMSQVAIGTSHRTYFQCSYKSSQRIHVRECNG